ncbi:hypothetical protein PR003_g10720 [Phytophthora rubi]|nr:hypothetical protein PR003_g10720 [Phytophthora rubi]
MRAHVGKRVCLEIRYPSLKTQRLQKARENKREYDKLYHQARRDALTEIGLRLITPAVLADVDAVPAGTLPSSPRDTSGPERPRPRIRQAGRVLERRRPTTVSPPVTIEVSDDDEEDESRELCAVCQDLPVFPVTPRSCRHAMCAECMSEYVARSLQEEDEATCPVCRVLISM